MVGGTPLPEVQQHGEVEEEDRVPELAEDRKGEAKASTEERYPIPEVAKEEEAEATAEEEGAEPVALKAKAAVAVEAV